MFSSVFFLDERDDSGEKGRNGKKSFQQDDL